MNIIQKFLDEKGYSHATEKSYSWVLSLFFKDHLVSSLGKFSTRDFRNWLDKNSSWGDNMRYLAYCSIRSFLRWKFENHPALKYKLRREKTPPQRTLNDKQIEKLYQFFDTSGFGRQGKKGVRDIAIFSMALDTGLRSLEKRTWSRVVY